MTQIIDCTSQQKSDLFEYVLRIADDRLVLGHRLSEWCGHAPILEEDIALANISLDLIGQANHWLELAGDIEGKGRSADQLAYTRGIREYRNSGLVERPRGDFAFTIVRQYLFDQYSVALLAELEKSQIAQIAALAARGIKEETYHLRHSSEWVKRLGDGTSESHRRTQAALEELWMYTGELFEADPVSERLVTAGLAICVSKIKSSWLQSVRSILSVAKLKIPDEKSYMFLGARKGLHSEYLGHLLDEMQSLPRAYPQATW